MALGEYVQIDHMTVTKNGFVVKNFQAWDRNSKFIYAQVYSQATSSSGARFLIELVAKAPFKIKSIQVDGGSEFMKDFEETCKELGIPLYVLPPIPICNNFLDFF
jgi:IS30 family transposase